MEQDEAIDENKGLEKEKTANNRKNNRARKGIGTLWDNIKGAIKGNVKDIFIMKTKLTIYVIIGIMVFFALIVEGDAEDTSATSSSSIGSVYSSGTAPASPSNPTKPGADTTEVTIDISEVSKELYENTGSLLLATDAEIEGMKNTFLTSIENSRPGYYEALSTVYSGKTSNTVANKVVNITTNFNANETTEVPKVTNSVVKVAGAASASDEKTIYEHILSTEKYNFNNIIWRSFQKSGGGLTSSNVKLRVDSDSKLIYPESDPGATNNDKLDLDFYISRVRPYLQSWYIPFDMAIGTIDSQAYKSLNADFAYEIITSAYHEIVFDRYKIENLDRTTNYLVYDQTTTTSVTIRTCATYEVPLAGGRRTVQKKLCTDKTENSITTKKDIRQKAVSAPDKSSYSWTYLISMAKMFDKVISTEYEFTPYYEYSTDNYNNYIEKKGAYKDITVEEYRESERTNSRADSFTTEDKDYNDEIIRTLINKSDWNENYYRASLPDGAKMIDEPESKIIRRVQTTVRNGKEYTDKYSWTDTLKFSGTSSGIYNIDSVKNVTDDDLSSKDQKYYNDIYQEQELNLIDLMNADNEIYERYLEREYRNKDTTNIGINKASLDISYNVLKEDLTDLAEAYPLSGLRYGSSLDILEGLYLGNIAAAGGVNEAMVMAAESHLGYTLADMMAIDKYGIFGKGHWCAMYVSYCMRLIEEQMGIEIPIPTYYSCTEFWKANHLKPGYFDVKEWVEVHQHTSERCNKIGENDNNIAPLASIQPGDIIFFCWEKNSDSQNWRDHTAIVKSVEKDASGNVISVTTLDGNTGGTDTADSYEYSSVNEKTKVAGGGIYTGLSSIASFVSVSTVLAEAEKGNVW